MQMGGIYLAFKPEGVSSVKDKAVILTWAINKNSFSYKFKSNYEWIKKNNMMSPFNELN